MHAVQAALVTQRGAHTSTTSSFCCSVFWTFDQSGSALVRASPALHNADPLRPDVRFFHLLLRPIMPTWLAHAGNKTQLAL